MEGTGQGTGAPARTAYDEVVYPCGPAPHTHPNRLAALAWLHGLTPGPTESCRVLELGCADGSNLIPMALACPEGRFVGVDLAPSSIERGRRVIAALGLSNVELEVRNVSELGAELGEFDYAIAHGLYSWVPAEVRDHLLAVASSRLAPDGMAYVSYNTYPGCHMRGMVRDILLFHAGQIADPERRIEESRALAGVLVEAQGVAPHSLEHAFFAQELAQITEKSRGAVFHDDLAPVCQAVYFHEFAAHAARHGLQYVCEADSTEVPAERYPPSVREAIDRWSDGDIVRREQYLDFVRCRRFRQTLLCRSGRPVSHAPIPSRLDALQMTAGVRRVPAADAEAGTVTYAVPNGSSMTTRHPVAQAVLDALGDAWPGAVGMDALERAAMARLDALGAELRATAPLLDAVRDILIGLQSAGIVDVTYRPTECARVPGARPLASRLARHQAQHGRRVTTLTHRTVEFEDDLGLHLVTLLDGTRDRPDIVRDLRALVEGGRVASSADVTADTVGGKLDELGRLGLLVA